MHTRWRNCTLTKHGHAAAICYTRVLQTFFLLRLPQLRRRVLFECHLNFRGEQYFLILERIFLYQTAEDIRISFHLIPFVTMLLNLHFPWRATLMQVAPKVPAGYPCAILTGATVHTKSVLLFISSMCHQ